MISNCPSSSTGLQQLKEKLQEYLYPSFAYRSRIHHLRSFPGNCFVKREDELGFGISGTKLRKYLSLLPSLLQDKPDAAVLTGSAYSNHVLSFSQLLKENRIEPFLLLLGDPSCKKEGNLLYTTLIAGTQNIEWVSRKKWEEVDQIAERFAAAKNKENKKTVIIPKGANCAAALPGALTLLVDLLRNEEEEKVCFDHIFIDSGTGMTAAALILGLMYMRKSTFVHVVQVAGKKEEFYETLEKRKKEFETLVGEPFPSPTQFALYTPRIAPSFGSVNSLLFQTIAEIACKEGFLTDPIFTAKLFHEAKKILYEQKLQGNCLLLHSGGGLSLTGFQKQLAKAL